jgi:Minor capsid protein
MLDAIDSEADSKTPKKEGNLRRDKLKQVLGLHAEITWKKGYAAAQEVGTTRGYPIKNYSTPGTGAHYAENAVKKVVDDSDQYFKQAGV